MRRLVALLVGLACVAFPGCTKAQLLVVTHAAAEACDVVEVITEAGAPRGVCLAVDALARLLDELLAAERLGVGVVLVVQRPEGGEERLTVASEGVKALAARVGAAAARVKR